MAANFPEQPTPRQQNRMETFLQVLGDFYPCEVCASHFRKHAAEHPIVTTSRKDLSLWICEAHNEVSRRDPQPRAAPRHPVPPKRNPTRIASRARWTQVNVRNGKDAYYCDLGVLDARWKDCGCGHNTTSSSSAASSARLPMLHRRRKARARSD